MDHSKKQQTKAEILLFFVAAVWGSSFILMKIGLQYASTFQLIGMRFTLGSLLVGAVFFRRLKQLNRSSVFIALLLSLLLSAATILQMIGLNYTTATNSGFITGLSAILVPFVAFLFFGRRTTFYAVIGIVFASVGLFFLSTNGEGLTKLNFGDGITFISAFLYAMFIVCIDRWIKKEHSVATGILILLFSAVTFDMIWLIAEPQPVKFSLPLIVIILVTGLLCTAFGYIGQIYAQKFTTPVRAALLLTFEPVFAPIFAVLIPDSFGHTETLTVYGIFGACLVVFGMITAEFGSFFHGTRLHSRL